uniref:myoferlin-like isoform X1 n=1 Tax=Myxine glutinosa TaxID=7769 RepID=UPI00358DE12B
MLKVLVLSAENLPNVDKFGKSDPYCLVALQEEKKKTKVIKNKVNPVWDELITFELKDILEPTAELHIDVKDDETIGKDKFLGAVSVSLRGVAVAPNHAESYTLNLLDEQKQPTAATLIIEVTYNPPPGMEGPNAEVGGVSSTPGEGAQDGSGGIEGGSAGSLVIPSQSASGAGANQRVKGHRNLHDKEQDLQVRVRIIEGRQLQGGGENMKPVVTVTVGTKTKRTRIKKSTNPIFDEVLYFNFFMKPSELFDDKICMTVLNSVNARQDAEIGTFKIDVGSVYSERRHAFIRKWVLLSDSDESTMVARGFLKVTLMVLATGDEAPAERKLKKKDEDVESNVLWPAGVSMRSLVFTVRLYRAEDIPQMDNTMMQGVKSFFGKESKKKNMVDPFVQFDFAGKTLKTDVIRQNANPEFNQTVNMAIKFPSMCSAIKLTMFDWDRASKNDPIGTIFLDISKISMSGGSNEGETSDDESSAVDTSGFLPTFGPCFLNMYGNLREPSTTNEFEDLNLGEGEGMAYRGRLLLEVVTKLDEEVPLPKETIANDDLLRVEKYLRRRKFSLFAAFYSATMLEELDDAVQFEVSMGNYGNKFDSSCKPLASVTQFSRVVFDGCNYYFLPWIDKKPVISLSCFWEDINFRLHMLNKIIFTCDRLARKLKDLQYAMKAKLPEQQLASVWLSLVDQVIEDCSEPFVIASDVSTITPLDLKLQKVRNQVLKKVFDAASKMRQEATQLDDTMSEIQDWHDWLQNMAEEPQNSMPDVTIWMLVGNKREAYCRIPAYDVLNGAGKTKGKHCGITQTLFLKPLPDEKKKDKVPAQLRVRFWLGLASEEKKINEATEGKLAVFVETYENQFKLFGSWGTKGLTGCPKWSDVTGKIKLKKESFMPPRGWRWDLDWQIDPEKNMLLDADAGHKSYVDEIYMNEERSPDGTWGPASVENTNVKGDATAPISELPCPPGWVVVNDWNVDLDRAVDESGWEYGSIIAPATKPSSWQPVEKMYHTNRRQRMTRQRKSNIARDQYMKQVEDSSEGWEYASLFGWKFHVQQRNADSFRRRRWRRRMMPAQHVGDAAVFALEGSLVGFEKDEDSDEESSAQGANVPMASCIFEKPEKFHLRCYIYQGRQLIAMDNEKLSDCYCVVSFLHRAKKTEVIKSTLNPTWDQTLIFQTIDIFGSLDSLKKDPPQVVVELFDKDDIGGDDYMGRCMCKPLVKLSPKQDIHPNLVWHTITKGDLSGGELLASFELILKTQPDGSDLPLPPPKRAENIYMVPQGIRPVLQRTRIEILAWGLRGMQSYQLSSVNSPNLVIECGGASVASAVIKNLKKNPNFSIPVMMLDVSLPKEEIYCPPIIIKVIDNRAFGRKPTVGQYNLRSLDMFRKALDNPDEVVVATRTGTFECQPGSEIAIDMEDSGPLLRQLVGTSSAAVEKMASRPKPEENITEDDLLDWWSKFYASKGEITKCGTYLEKGFDTLKVYPTELEEVKEFYGLRDFCQAFTLYRGKVDESDEDQTIAGEFKGSFRIYPLPDDPTYPEPPLQFKHLPDVGLQDCIVRVYVIQGINLQPKDSNGKCDPYIKIKLGKHRVDDSDNYKPNTLNPVFGRMYELTCTLPLDKDLEVRLYDHDMLMKDDKIGETKIDLENRYLSLYGARCGLPQNYYESGPNKWRDQVLPSFLLNRIASVKGWPAPRYDADKLIVRNTSYNIHDIDGSQPTNSHLGSVKERLALHVLRTMGFVPEHVETRSLFNKLQPGIEQGRLLMWVDIFPKAVAPPGPPFDISPRRPMKFELRCIIWNVADVTLDETSITGEKMSDIYLKGWMEGMEKDRQKTDVHYRSLGGEGNFNWRFIFPFDYLPAENACLVSSKEHFWNVDATESRVSPQLLLQVWDNDKFSADDSLGMLHLDLHQMPRSVKMKRSCDLDQLPDKNDKTKSGKDPKLASLFKQKCSKGWWPCYMEDKNGNRSLTGKIEMTLEIVNEKECTERPAGQGREEPNMNPKLEEPQRPETSFLWFTSPLKTCKYIIWKRFKIILIVFIVIAFVAIFVGIFLYSLANYSAEKIILG